MQPLGTLLLVVAYFTTLATALTAIFGAVTRNETLVRGARYGVYANVALYIAMAGILWHGYFAHDFANKYISAYSDREMPALYLFTSFWGGEKGALLFWATVLCVFSGIAVHQARDKDVSYLGWAMGLLMLAVFFYDILMVFASNPFETFLTISAHPDGDGLNPLLQNPTMAIHPPSLLTGYIAFTLPFCFGAASLITGRLDDQWAKDTRKWTIVSWLFLTTGLILGGAWAYQELGWGGFWMWDPVENAGLIPWFTATAFLHSIIIQERRGMLRRWNFSLVCVTFWLTIFGTFLTRSQLIVSIHAFADSKLSDYFIVYMVVIAAVSYGLLMWRWHALRAKERIESFLSREAFFVLNNVMLVLCAFVVMWGTLYSKISEAKGFQNLYNSVVGLMANFNIHMEELHQAQDLGEPWFNRVMVPTGIALLFLTAVGPLIAWRRTTMKSFRGVFLIPLMLSSVPMFVGTLSIVIWRSWTYGALINGSIFDGYSLWVVLVELGDFYAWLTIWFGLFVLTGVGWEYWKGGRIRQRKRGGSLVGNMWTLSLKAKRRYGGYIIHIGAAMAFVGFAGVAFKTRAREAPLQLGHTRQLGKYHLTFAKMEDAYAEGEGFASTVAHVVVLQPKETVPVEEVDRVVAWLDSKNYGPFQVETRIHSAKIMLWFEKTEHQDMAREELYLRGLFRERFVPLGFQKGDALWSRRFGFRDQKLIQVVPQVKDKHLDHARLTLGSLGTGRALVRRAAANELSVIWACESERKACAKARRTNPKAECTCADFDRAQALLREDKAPLEDVLLAQVNVKHGALEIVTSRTGKLLSPEVRRYQKHGSPTTEVAIWSRPHEDVYLAMRPDHAKSFINLVAYVNPLINLLWLGSVLMFIGGVFLLFPTDVFLSRARKLAASTAKVDSIILAAILSAAILAGPGLARAQEAPPGQKDDAWTRKMLGAMKCACDDSGELVFSDKETLNTCSCAVGAGMRRRVRGYLASQPPERKNSLEAQESFLEGIIAQQVSSERYLIYSSADLNYLLENTMCSCGCGKMALSQCPLDCPWQPRVKRKLKIRLALGLDLKEARKRYLADANRAHRVNKPPLTLDDITLNQETYLSWFIPLASAVGATGLILLVLGYRMRVNRRENERELAAADEAPKPVEVISELDRDLLSDELEDVGG